MPSRGHRIAALLSLRIAAGHGFRASPAAPLVAAGRQRRRGAARTPGALGRRAPFPAPPGPGARPRSRPAPWALRAAAAAAVGDRAGDGASHDPNRPAWALPWMPTWLVALRPRTQFLVGLILYVFHLKVLTQHHLVFPFQLVPNDEGWFQSLGLDSLAGMLSFGGLVWLRKASVAHVASSAGAAGGAVEAVPPIWTAPTEAASPWRLRSKKQPTQEKRTEDLTRDANETLDPQAHPRPSAVVAFLLLLVGYFSTGRLSLLFENLLYYAAGCGMPLTVPMVGLVVVLGCALFSGKLSFSLCVEHRSIAVWSCCWGTWRGSSWAAPSWPAS